MKLSKWLIYDTCAEMPPMIIMMMNKMNISICIRARHTPHSHTHTHAREHACRLKEFDEQIYFIRLISFID